MTTPQMDWLDDQRRKRAVSSDDIVRRMKLMDVPPGSYDEETLYDAVAEIKRLRAEIERLPAVARADDIVKQLEWLHGEFYDVDSVTSIVELAKAEIERLRTEFSAVLGDAIAKDAENERLRAAGDALEHSLLMWQSKHPHLDLGYDALAAWQEARRG